MQLKRKSKLPTVIGLTTIVQSLQYINVIANLFIMGNYLKNCAEKLLEPTIFFNLNTKSPLNAGSKSPWRKRDLSPNGNLDIKSYSIVDSTTHCAEKLLRDGCKQNHLISSMSSTSSKCGEISSACLFKREYISGESIKLHLQQQLNLCNR